MTMPPSEPGDAELSIELETPLKVVMMLADYAVVADGKLTIVGAGWSFTGPNPSPSAIALLFQVPWDQTNRAHTWTLSLKDSDGNPFVAPDGEPLQVGGEFEAGRPPGHPVGTTIPMPLAISFAPLPLAPGTRYEWEVAIDGESHVDWRVAFNTRPDHGG